MTQFLLTAIATICLTVSACSARNDETVNTAEDMRAFLSGMPKAELHLHLEGTLSPATIVEITNRNGIDYFTTIEEVLRVTEENQ